MDVVVVRNPYTGAVVGTVPAAGADDADRAVTRAWEAFRADDSLPIDRYTMLRNAWKGLDADRQAIARLICAETAKPIRECGVEVDRACTTLLWSAEESLRVDGTIHPCGISAQRVDKLAHVVRAPAGVVLAITPFNFPLNIPAHKIGPALAAGNAVIVKPSPKAPLTTQRLVDLLHEAGVPAGMLQILHGGAEVVERLACAPVSVVSFTGGTTAGSKVAHWASGKKVVLELGGNDAIVVMDDADLDRAAQTIVAHRFGFSGQRCTACKRAVLHESVYDAMKDRLLQGVAALVLGDPSKDETDMGPLIDDQAAAALLAKVEYARAAGATVLCGGTRRGALVAPTLVEDVDAAAPLCREENFGPVLPLLRFSNFDEAVRIVNGTPYGLQAGLFTNRMDVVRQAFRRFDVGTVVVNDGPALRVEPIPFGGVKASGFGREGIRYAIDEFTVLKTLVW